MPRGDEQRGVYCVDVVATSKRVGGMSARLFGLTILLLAQPALAGDLRPGPGTGTLVVQVRSDLRPGTDFSKIRTDVLALRGGNHPIVRREMTARRGVRLDRGVRVAEIRLANRKYRVVVTALTSTNNIVAQRPARVEITGGVRVLTILLARTGPAPPVPGACQNKWNQEKRLCGRVLGACIRGAQGRPRSAHPSARMGYVAPHDPDDERRESRAAPWPAARDRIRRGGDLVVLREHLRVAGDSRRRPW